MILRIGDERHLGKCIVIEADMDALALIDEVKRRGADTLVVLGPLHREGRRRGIYVSKIEPSRATENPSRLVKKLWGNLTGSLRLEDYVTALQILYDKEFYVAECEPGKEEKCSDVVEQWLRNYCEET